MDELSIENKALMKTNRVLTDQLQLICGRIYELEKQVVSLSEPVVVRNKTGREILVSQVDSEYVSIHLTRVLSGERKLLQIGTRTWEVS
ncbi:MAG: hypothetical protein DRI46_10435 [Chloroflexi bacterium]|nr:MAG: hypothetical protein DRI46_10435 [Chloroflexota bacterium]